MASNQKFVFLTLLVLLGSSTFSIFSNLEINFFLKGYGLIFSLQAGLAAIYLSRRQWFRR